MTNVSEEHQSEHAADAVVVSDEPVKLWKDGAYITASSRDIGMLQQQGWLTRSPDDVPGLLAEIKVLAGKVSDNIAEFVKAVQDDGYIDAADGAIYASSLKSRQLLDEKVTALLDVMHAAYPMRQGEASTLEHGDEVVSHDPNQTPMTDPEGNLRMIDPEQVSGLAKLGWKKA